MDNTNSTFDIEVSKKSETKEKAIQYKKYDKSKQNKEVVEVAKQESENVTKETVKEEVVKEETPKKKALKEGWARGVIQNKWKTSAWIVLEDGNGLTIDNASQYSIGEKIEFELPQWYRNLKNK